MPRSLFFSDRVPVADTRRVESLGVDNALSRALYRRDWSETALARESGISRCRINQIKNGYIAPSLFDALAISTALKMRISDLFVIARRGRRSCRKPRLDPLRTGSD